MNRNSIYRLGALLGLLSLGGIIYLHVDADEQSTTRAVFETTGHTARDVVNALVELDQLETAPASPTSDLARQAILKAERNFGLPADGMADRVLLDRLMADLAANDIEPATGPAWTHVAYGGIKFIEVLGGLITFGVTVLGFLGFRRD
ncbi:MAG: hypothetical protein ACR2QF_15675 [Geminicoccaceae bacterium]